MPHDLRFAPQTQTKLLLNKENMDFKEFNDRVRDIEYGNSGPSYSAAFPALIRKVYLWMTFALAISGIVAYGVATSPNLLMLIYSNKLVFWGIIAVNFLLVWKISGSTMKPNRSLSMHRQPSSKHSLLRLECLYQLRLMATSQRRTCLTGAVSSRWLCLVLSFHF